MRGVWSGRGQPGDMELQARLQVTWGHCAMWGTGGPRPDGFVGAGVPGGQSLLGGYGDNLDGTTEAQER